MIRVLNFHLYIEGQRLSSRGQAKAFNMRSHHQSISQHRAPKHDGLEFRSASIDSKRIPSMLQTSRSRSNTGLFETDEDDNDHPPLLMSSIDGPLSTQVIGRSKEIILYIECKFTFDPRNLLIYINIIFKVNTMLRSKKNPNQQSNNAPIERKRALSGDSLLVRATVGEGNLLRLAHVQQVYNI